jgi:hypothetical protein
VLRGAACAPVCVRRFGRCATTCLEGVDEPGACRSGRAAVWGLNSVANPSCMARLGSRHDIADGSFRGCGMAGIAIARQEIIGDRQKTPLLVNARDRYRYGATVSRFNDG